MTTTSFDLLAEPLQRCLWRMGWTDLRPIQDAAIRAVLQTDDDLILSAHTAAGKTEAAFLPILSRLVEQPPNSVGVVYVSPLKALINDQFRRLEELCEHAEIPVHRWHGDVGQAAKRRLIDNPAGVLLITPESLESLFVNRSSSISRVLRHLQFVVIDELHAFVGRERGLHLRSLLFRVAQKLERDCRLVALSATLGDWESLYAKWMRPDQPSRVRVISDAGQDRSIRFRIYGFTIGEGQPTSASPDPLAQDDEEGHGDIVSEMLHAFGGKKNLVFANRKDQVEWFADALNERCRRTGRSAEFLVHHGSVSKDVREYTETAMRSATPHTTICSSTLELGIDIGSVEEIGQIGAPWSVSSLVQRLGRSGRRDGTPSKMRLFVEDLPQSDKANLVDRLRPELLQAIALTELMLSKWLEPPNIDAFDLSTLAQQTLSVLTETGGISAPKLFERLVSRGAFTYVDQPLLAALLRSLGGHNLIEQMAEGDLILATEGERLVKRFDFYSAFTTQKEYAVLNAGQIIGTLPAVDPPPPGEHVLLGGRRWKVTEVNASREEILVVAASGKKTPVFRGAGGEIHTVVRQTMRDVLFGNKPIAYLNPCAMKWLDDARAAASDSGLAINPWHRLAPNQSLLFTWAGTRTQRTILLLAETVGLKGTDHDIAIEFPVATAEVCKRLREALKRCPTAADLTKLVPFKQRRKYDSYLTEQLLGASFEHDALNVHDASLLLGELVAN